MNQMLFIFAPERSHWSDKQSLESEEDEEGKTSDCSQELTVVVREWFGGWRTKQPRTLRHPWNTRDLLHSPLHKGTTITSGTKETNEKLANRRKRWDFSYGTIESEWSSGETFPLDSLKELFQRVHFLLENHISIYLWNQI